jgi:hypothetical protein
MVAVVSQRQKSLLAHRNKLCVAAVESCKEGDSYVFCKAVVCLLRWTPKIGHGAKDDWARRK